MHWVVGALALIALAVAGGAQEEIQNLDHALAIDEVAISRLQSKVSDLESKVSDLEDKLQRRASR